VGVSFVTSASSIPQAHMCIQRKLQIDTTENE
jgi:hypothetical protein